MLHLGKRVDPTPAVSAELTDHPAGCGSGLRGKKIQGGHCLPGLFRRRRGQVPTGRRAKGRFIRHASFPALTVLTLTVAVIVAPLGRLLVAAVGLAALEAKGLLPAAGTAITLAAVTATAEIKRRTAGSPVAHALAKERKMRNQHRVGEETLDSWRRSCQDDSRCWRFL